MTSHNSRNSENEVWQNGIVDESLKMNDISHVKEKLRNELETRLGIESSVHINDDLSLLRKHSSKLSSIFDQNPHLVSALNVGLSSRDFSIFIPSLIIYTVFRHTRSWLIDHPMSQTSMVYYNQLKQHWIMKKMKWTQMLWMQLKN